MASQIQYEYFKFLYDHERARYLELVNRGKLYLSIITLYLGLLAVGADKTIQALNSSFSLQMTYMMSVVLLVGSLAFVVYAVGIYANEKPSDPEDIIKAIGKAPPTDDDFRDARIVDLAVATKRNSANNDRRAQRLKTATMFLLLGMLCQAAFLALLLGFPAAKVS